MTAGAGPDPPAVLSGVKRLHAAVHDINEARVRRAASRENKAGMTKFVQEMIKSSLVGIGFPEGYADEASRDMARDWADDRKKPSWRK